jgi:hypothetical protein
VPVSAAERVAVEVPVDRETAEGQQNAHHQDGDEDRDDEAPRSGTGCPGRVQRVLQLVGHQGGRELAPAEDRGCGVRGGGLRQVVGDGRQLVSEPGRERGGHALAALIGGEQTVV